jgi:hypothetical protein
MNKLEVQQRVLQNGKPLYLDKFQWDEKALVFSTIQDGLVIDFSNVSFCTFDTGSKCTFKTGAYCTFDTGSDCTFDTGSHCTFDTGSDCTFDTGSHCVIVNRNVFETITPGPEETIQICPPGIPGHLVNGLYKGEPHIIADGILSKIIKQKGNVYHVVNYGKNKKSYLIKKGDVYSHGETLKEAKEGLVYKLSDRETSKYNDYQLDTSLSKEDAIQMYMAITGACSGGTKYFVDMLGDNVKKTYLVSEIMEITKGQYGHESFVKFFRKGGD